MLNIISRGGQRKYRPNAMEILKGIVILLALSFRERLEATVKCKHEFRRFEIQNLLCAEDIL